MLSLSHQQPLLSHYHSARTCGAFPTTRSPEVKLDKLEALLCQIAPAIVADAPLYAALLSIPADGRYPALDLTPRRQKEPGQPSPHRSDAVILLMELYRIEVAAWPSRVGICLVEHRGHRFFWLPIVDVAGRGVPAIFRGSPMKNKSQFRSGRGAIWATATKT